MLGLNAKAPEFDLEGIQEGRARRFRLADFRGRWFVLFFYPADFTFVCPTEIQGFQVRIEDFEAAGARIAAASVDDIESHRAWAEKLGGLSYPLLSDPTCATCRDYGVLNEADGKAFRGTYIVTPEGTIGYALVSPMNVGRSVEETLRVLKALQTGRLCPADWKPGQETLDPGLKY